ncbi:unnamed protein product [Didymodactylos carnosus]|uniref:Uncharacterized protein n=1 Tax=Didymodactylos carnosus TaxID=1234261 RepID=A0A815GS28_9BILA|nr:unnamed protein product [Didymodactylos carnosus]CAF4208037.1 unnamed protein product [Didymodactylos carnosus]
MANLPSNVNHIVIWLDQRFSLPGSNERMKEKFRHVTNPLKTFDKPTVCIDFIDSVKDKKIFLITTGPFAQDLVREVHDLPQIEFIYIYTHDINDHSRWVRQYSKIGIEHLINFDENLLECLIHDIGGYLMRDGDKCERGRELIQAKQLYEYAKGLYDQMSTENEEFKEISNELHQRITKLSSKSRLKS